jgi:uncharacterized protein YprB with RNaseH-like and TPR domain
MKNNILRCYFDIETSAEQELTVAGMYFENGKLVQLVGNDITPGKIEELMTDTIVYTYNGSRFDIPFIKKTLGIDINALAKTHDLMYDCWNNNLRGGLKKVEQKLGIYRETEGLDGYDAVLLWQAYENGSPEALELLLTYNMEDVKNLEELRKKLGVE